jgi:hypothetical protein
MSNCLKYFATINDKIKIQKYLEKGHTQMEVDSVHAVIECKLKQGKLQNHTRLNTLTIHFLKLSPT